MIKIGPRYGMFNILKGTRSKADPESVADSQTLGSGLHIGRLTLSATRYKTSRQDIAIL